MPSEQAVVKMPAVMCASRYLRATPAAFLALPAFLSSSMSPRKSPSARPHNVKFEHIVAVEVDVRDEHVSVCNRTHDP